MTHQHVRVQVVQVWFDRFEVPGRRGAGVDVNDRQRSNLLPRQHGVGSADRREFMFVHDPPPDPTAERGCRRMGFGIQEDFPTFHDGNALTPRSEVRDSARGHHNNAVLGKLAQEIQPQRNIFTRRVTERIVTEDYVWG